MLNSYLYNFFSSTNDYSLFLQKLSYTRNLTSKVSALIAHQQNNELHD